MFRIREQLTRRLHSPSWACFCHQQESLRPGACVCRFTFPGRQLNLDFTGTCELFVLVLPSRGCVTSGFSQNKGWVIITLHVADRFLRLWQLASSLAIIPLCVAVHIRVDIRVSRFLSQIARIQLQFCHGLAEDLGQFLNPISPTSFFLICKMGIGRLSTAQGYCEDSLRKLSEVTYLSPDTQ